jgi:hypothetical protein
MITLEEGSTSHVAYVPYFFHFFRQLSTTGALSTIGAFTLINVMLFFTVIHSQ